MGILEGGPLVTFVREAASIGYTIYVKKNGVGTMVSIGPLPVICWKLNPLIQYINISEENCHCWGRSGLYKVMNVGGF